MSGRRPALILWRHADAGQPLVGEADFRRALSDDGQRRATQSAAWLRKRLGDKFVLLSSPALRAEQTAQALAEPTIDERLAPETSWGQIWTLINESVDLPLVLVGHQPWMGVIASAMLGDGEASAPTDVWTVRKSGVWVFGFRDDKANSVALEAVYNPGIGKRIR